MELLEAVNTVMPYHGEHVVTDVDTTKHPTVDLILMGLERNRKALLSEGWWFNDVIKVPLQPDTSGRIPAPSDSLNVYGSSPMCLNQLLSQNPSIKIPPSTSRSASRPHRQTSSFLRPCQSNSKSGIW